MTNSMLEQVARAMRRRKHEMWVEHATKMALNADQVDPYFRVSFDDLARAAIQAMREPSEGMTLEGAKASADQHYYKSNAWERCVYKGFQCDWLNGAKFGWQAMIDEALKE